MSRSIALAVALGATGVLAAPVASAQFSKPSKGQQVQLGKQAATEIRQKEKVLPDSDPRVQMLRRMGRKFLGNMNLKKEPWQFSFDVIESKDINAFALPGGPIFFYTGILDRMKTEDEVAGVLGHEITHVTREHWAYQMRKRGERQGLLVLGSIFGAPSAVLTAGQLYDSIATLQFSRGDETQADETGFKLMVASGYNPNGMVDVFRMLSSLGGRGGPEFLATHPDPGNRVKKLQGFVDKSKTTYPSLQPLPFDTGAKRGVYDKKATGK